MHTVNHSDQRSGAVSLQPEGIPAPRNDDEKVRTHSSPEPTGHPSAESRNVALPMGDGERILLVDDEETVRRVTGRLLEKLGYEVHTADDGANAVAILESGQTFDLILTDVVMPRMTGIEMAEKVRSMLPDQKILFTSGYTTRQYGRAPGEPPRPFMPKPFSLSDLAESVRATLDG